MTTARDRWRAAGLVSGPLLAALVLAVLPESFVDASGDVVPFAAEGRRTAALALWMAVWWITEALPLPATSLLPIVVLPLSGSASLPDATTPYAHPLIFLFLGGFVLSIAVQRWGLHRRLALLALEGVGADPRRIVFGFMAVTAGLSMWVSNTATAVMMLPIAQSVVDTVEREGDARVDEDQRRSFSLCILLGVAYGASIGGIGTLIGTPPNLVLASFAESQLGRPIGFARWMAVGLPLVVTFLPLTWWILTRWVYPVRLPSLPGGRHFARQRRRALGPVTRAEWATAAVFATTAAAWIARPLLTGIEVAGLRPLAGLSDTGVALLGALALFVLRVRVGPEEGPGARRSEPLVDWLSAREIPWGILLLFGGGLSLAAAIQANGVGEWIGSQVGGLAGWPRWALVAGVTALVIFLTEVTSNTATAAAFVPILAGLAPALGLDPLWLIVPAALAASCAFMLPVATPPNAVVFGSGRIRIAEMSRAGLWVNLLGVILIPLVTAWFAIPILGGAH